ncbi:hypothetical protein Y032_0076g1042 [Ancylostoma ceylanicum]|uniref:Uncharacterized protein n=1 Tax=Ancylostoma ceylanicum TaxID=53326 RepID=A0A016TUH1_9BILA|nr:hypothetical protein Y032_0076g1042 [Ancylostoma ceylanicum]
MSREGLGDDAYEQLGPGNAMPPPPPPPAAGAAPPPPPPPPSADAARNKPSKTTTLGQFALRDQRVTVHLKLLQRPHMGLRFSVLSSISIPSIHFRPGDDVDLSSERGTTLTGNVEGPPDKQQPPKKPKEKPEKEKKPEVPLKSVVLDIKPYKEPALLKFCHTITLLLLVLSFALMALTVVQFVDIFVWLPMIMGEND